MDRFFEFAVDLCLSPTGSWDEPPPLFAKAGVDFFQSTPAFFVLFIGKNLSLPLLLRMS